MNSIELNWIEAFHVCMHVRSISLFLSFLQSAQHRKTANLFSALHSIVFARFHFILEHWFRDRFDLFVCVRVWVFACKHTWVCMSVNTFFRVLPFAVFGLVAHSYVQSSAIVRWSPEANRDANFFFLSYGEKPKPWTFFSSLLNFA